jgi:Arc/MetJ-type ribon-helix-helix transcriptional regulator
MKPTTRKSATVRLDPKVAELLDSRAGEYASMSANTVINVAVRRLLETPSDNEVEQIARTLAKRDARILEALKNL